MRGTRRPQAAAGPPAPVLYQLMERVVELRRAGLAVSSGPAGGWIPLTAAGAGHQVRRDEALARELEEQERGRQMTRSRRLLTSQGVFDLTEEEEEEEVQPKRQGRGGKGRKLNPAQISDLL